MINPLNELSAVYQNNIAEGEKKGPCKRTGDPVCNCIPQGDSVDGGDTAKPGKDKNYVKPMATEGMKERAYSNWRNDSQDLLEVIGGAYGGVAGVDNEKNLENPKAKKASKSNQRITEKSVKNKIVINPPQGMKEAFAELGGVITEMYEISEKIDIKKADMGDVVKDFRKSDAPQFKGKSDKKKQEMAVAAKLATEETEEEKKKREMLEKTKEHDDKQSGKLAEADMTGAPSIKNMKPARKTNVKYDSHMKVMAPTIKVEGRALAGILSTIRAKNGMRTVTAKGADKLQAKKEKTMGEEMSVKDQMKISREAAKNRNPNPDHRKINAMKASKQKKDNRTDSQKMTDATGPRPGSNYRGD